MLAQVATTIRRRALYGPDDRVAAAMSGGADSVALALVLRALEARGGAALAGLIHVNHGLRGADSDADEAFCRAFAARSGLRFESTGVDVAALARSRGCSIEVAAREARYAFFPEAAARLGATVVVTGHTRDDQAETVLLRLLRGAGTRGLSGIRPRRGIYVRPLIDVSREDILRYLTSRREPWREDRSNADATIPRNRIRHELMPVIRSLAPGGPRALARLADLAADDEAVLTARAIEILPRIVLSRRGSTVQVDVHHLARLPAAVARRAIGLLGDEVARGVVQGVGHLEAVRRLACADTPKGPLDLPGLTVSRTGMVLTLGAPSRHSPHSSNAAPFSRCLPVPGTVSIPEAGVMVTAELGAITAADLVKGGGGDGRRVMLQASAVVGPLTVRSRRPGDRFRPLGAPGRRKLQDLLVDRKVPRAERDLVPIVEDAHGHVLWVAGVAVAEAGRVTAPEAGVVILELRKDQ